MQTTRRTKKLPRPLTTTLTVDEKPLDRRDLYAAAVPFIASVLQRWQQEKRVIVVDGVLRVNPDYKPE